MTEGDKESRRRIILHPRTALARQQDRARTYGSHVRGYTVDTGEVMELLRKQRRLSLRLLLAILVPVLCFPLVFRFAPQLGTQRLFGILPLPWFVLGPATLFLIVIVAFVHERRALAIERRWVAEKVEP